jgi:hypothetical protein
VIYKKEGEFARSRGNRVGFFSKKDTDRGLDSRVRKMSSGTKKKFHIDKLSEPKEGTINL